MEKYENIKDDEKIAFFFLAFKGMLNPSVDDNLYDKNGKLLFGIDVNDNIIFADGLTVEDNILYTLTEEDKIFYTEDSDIIPKQIEIIFAEDIKTYKVVFDANEGIFRDSEILTIEEWENGIEDTLEEPTREGYKFLGFFTQKTGGTKLELILAEEGIIEDTTFYAQWEKVVSNDGQEGPAPISQPPDDKVEDNNNIENTINTGNINTNKPIGNNPQTGDNIVFFAVISLMAAIGLMITIKIKKYVKQ